MGKPENDQPKKPRPWLIPLIILGVSMVAAAILFPYLPEQIPLHFSLTGEVTRYGSKYTVFLIALLPTVIYIGIRRRYGRK